MELFFRLPVDHNCGYRVNNDLFRILELPHQGLEKTGKIHTASTFSWLLAAYSENNAGGQLPQQYSAICYVSTYLLVLSQQFPRQY